MRILKLLSPRWSRDPFMRELALALSRPLEAWATMIAARHIYLDPQQAPPEWLPWLAERVGWPHWPGLPEQRRRDLIEVACKTWDRKGGTTAMQDWLRAVTGTAAIVRNATDTAFVAGVSRAGDVCGPGVLAYALEVEVPASAGYSEATIRELLRPQMPGFCTYTVTFV